MTVYNSEISRIDSAALIPEDAANVILKALPETSFALSGIFPKVTMSRKQRRIPALTALPYAYFVDGDAGLKQTTELGWGNKFLNAEEIAVIVPIPEAVLDDAAFDIWGESTPKIAEAIGRTFDAAMAFGTAKPAAWEDGIVDAALAAGNAYDFGTNTVANGGVAEDINHTLALLEADGYDCGLHVAPRAFKSVLRGLRDSTGQKLLDLSTSEIEGAPVKYMMSGLWPDSAVTDAARLICMDPTQFLVGIRSDISYKILTEAVITDANKAIIYNLAQQDMVALRVVFRAAWCSANPVNFSNTDDNTRYPASLLVTSDIS